MDRKKFVQNFSHRLTQLMRKEGHETCRTGGVGLDLSKLARVTGCSYQMARKYALGQAFPEIPVLMKMATWLKVSPSWLLFGDDDSQVPTRKIVATIEIEPALLRYILNKSAVLFKMTNNTEDIVNFIADIIYDASHLNTDAKTVHKIIDMMLSSAMLLNKVSKGQKSVAHG